MEVDFLTNITLVRVKLSFDPWSKVLGSSLINKKESPTKND